MLKMAMSLLAAAMVYVALVIIFYALFCLPETGPGCQADPEWLGFCHDIDKP